MEGYAPRNEASSHFPISLAEGKYPQCQPLTIRSCDLRPLVKKVVVAIYARCTGRSPSSAADQDHSAFNVSSSAAVASPLMSKCRTASATASSEGSAITTRLLVQYGSRLTSNQATRSLTAMNSPVR